MVNELESSRAEASLVSLVPDCSDITHKDPYTCQGNIFPNQIFLKPLEPEIIYYLKIKYMRSFKILPPVFW